MLVVAAVLVGLLVVADRAAAYLAASAVADAVQRDQRLSSAPDVDIGGFPFLTQAVAGVYDEVDLHLADASVQGGGQGSGQGGVPVTDVVVRLRGVHVPAGDAVRGAVAGVPVDDADARATVSFAALTAQLDQAAGAAGGVRIGPGGGPDLLSVSGVLPVQGATVPVRAEVRLALSRGVLRATVTPSSLAGVPASARSRVEGVLSRLSVRLPALPFGFAFSSVTTGDGGLTVGAIGRRIVLRS